MSVAIRRFWTEESGQGLPEYALLVAAVVVLTVIVGMLYTSDVTDLFNEIGTYIDDHNGV